MRSCKKKRRARATLMQEEGVETNFNNGSFQKQHEEEEDRLSSLPDSLLITVISLLPINFAAATSVLSQRWRYVWTHTTHLFIDQTFDSREYFVTTLNHIISQLQSPKLHTFHLQTSLPNSPPNATTPFYSFLLVDQICLRNPEIFMLNLCFMQWFDDNFPIPSCLFETQSLVELKLFANLGFNFLHHDHQLLSFKFPNLKKLGLSLNASNCGLIGRNSTLFTACPLLEVLRLDFFFLEDATSTLDVECLLVDIPTPNLKFLRIYVSGDSVDYKFKIVAPKLEKCYIEGHLMLYEFVSNPTTLLEAKISIGEICFGDDYNYNSEISALIQGISCVKSLSLKISAIYLLDSMSNLTALPFFQNLIHLSFSYSIDYDIHKLPGCFLLGNLKTVDITDLGCINYEFNVIKHILSNATALEKFCIFATQRGGGNFEYGFCKKLFMLPKSSINCLVEFYGELISVSSDDYEGVLSICQIRDHDYYWD